MILSILYFGVYVCIHLIFNNVLIVYGLYKVLYVSLKAFDVWYFTCINTHVFK